MQVGDANAKKYFKEEVAKRYQSGFENVRHFLINGGYLNHFTDEE